MKECIPSWLYYLWYQMERYFIFGVVYFCASGDHKKLVKWCLPPSLLSSIKREKNLLFWPLPRAIIIPSICDNDVTIRYFCWLFVFCVSRRMYGATSFHLQHVANGREFSSFERKGNLKGEISFSIKESYRGMSALFLIYMWINFWIVLNWRLDNIMY